MEVFPSFRIETVTGNSSPGSAVFTASALETVRLLSKMFLTEILSMIALAPLTSEPMKTIRNGPFSTIFQVFPDTRAPIRHSP